VLHGCSFTLVFVTTQIYLDQRVDAAWRARAQALMSLMNGLGNLAGYVGVGLWFNHCVQPGFTRWSLFWGGLAMTVALVMAYFILAYRGQGSGFTRAQVDEKVK